MRSVVAFTLLTACSSDRAPVRQEPVPDALPDAGAETAAPSLTDAQQKALDDYLAAEHATHALPALAVGVVLDDALVYQRGFGTADGKAGGPPIDAHSVFRIGSITKVMTGVAVLQRRDQKKLDLDDPVDQYVPELASLVSPAGQPKVTIRHLVTHTSGIPSIGDGTADYWTGDHDVTEKELFDALLNAKLEFAPGSKVAYSNFAVALAGIIVARVSGEPYRDVMEGSLFAPLKMTESAWDRAVVNDRLARGHWLSATGFTAAGPHWRLGAAEPAGGLYSTVADMARFLTFEGRAQTALEDFDSVLIRSSLRESQTADAKLGSPFGVGWYVGKDDLGAFVTHNGSVVDYSATVKLYPERRAAIVALLATGSSEVLDCIGDQALGSLFRAAPPAACKPKLTSANATALDRVRALISAPSAEAIDAAFSPRFLASMSRDELLKFFNDCNATYGACTESTTIMTADNGAVRARLTCAKAPANVLVAADPLIELLYVAPGK